MRLFWGRPDHLASLRNAEHRVAQRSYSSTRENQIIDYIVLQFASARFQTTTHLSKPSGRFTKRIKSEVTPVTALSHAIASSLKRFPDGMLLCLGGEVEMVDCPQGAQGRQIAIPCSWMLIPRPRSVYCMYRFAAEILSNKN
jgi:hypothetical protein